MCTTAHFLHTAYQNKSVFCTPPPTAKKPRSAPSPSFCFPFLEFYFHLSSPGLLAHKALLLQFVLSWACLASVHVFHTSSCLFSIVLSQVVFGRPPFFFSNVINFLVVKYVLLCIFYIQLFYFFINLFYLTVIFLLFLLFMLYIMLKISHKIIS